MNAKVLAVVLVRVVAAVLIVEGAAFLTHKREDPRVFLGLINLIVGLPVFAAATRIGERLVGGIEDFGAPVDGQRIQSIAFSILGAYLLVDGLAQMAGVAYTLWAKPGWVAIPTLDYLLEERAQPVGSAIVHTVGGAILIGAAYLQVLTRTWRMIRSQD